MKKMLFICNPLAGQRRVQRLMCEVLDIFSALGWTVTVHITQSRGDASRASAELGAGCDRIVCCGGDGTFNEVINGAETLENPPPLGYIPAGTTNDFAATLGLSADILEAAKAAAGEREKHIDLGLFGTRYFSYIASFGAFTESSYNVSQELKNSFGHFAYVCEGIRELSGLKPSRVKIAADERVFEDYYIFGAIANTTSIGGILKLGEDEVDLADGLFEVILVRNPKSLSELSELVKAVNTRRFDVDGITFFHTSRVKLITDGIPWSIDGEKCEDGGQVEVKNIRNALRIIV